MDSPLSLLVRPRPAAGSFVCPLCGTTLADDRDACPRCDGNLVVPVEDRQVYRTVVPLCGSQCDLEATRPAGNPNPKRSRRCRRADPLFDTLARLSDALRRPMS